MQAESARPQQNDAVEIVRLVSKELLHGFLISAVLEVTADLETLDVGVFVGSFDHHANIVNCAYISFSDVYNDTGISLLL